MKQKKRLTSWQKRKKRRVKMLLRTTLFCVVAFIAIIFVKSLLFYERVDISDYCTLQYGGYNHKGSVKVDVDYDKVSELMRTLREDYDKRFIHVYPCASEDYNNFYNSISVNATVPNNLSNGSTFAYTVSYDKDLAKKMRLGIKSDTKVVTVSGLVTAAVVTLDDLFKDLAVTFEGASPQATVTIENNSKNPYVQNMVFSIIEPQEYYSLGDTIKVRAYFSEEECLDKHFAVEKPSEECIKEYTVENLPSYIQTADELPQEIVMEAVKAAAGAFTKDSALEFGLRVWSEANMMYSIDPRTKKYTFDWASYGPLSAYFKVPDIEIAGKNGNSFNDIDVVYNFVMTQSDGKTCDGEAVVRFTNISKQADGTYDYDFSNPKIHSASHYDSRIKKNVIKNYENNYSIEKLTIK